MPIKVIVACEFSGVVRDAFIRAGHDAVSCDWFPTERPGPHIQDDIRSVDLSPYDLMIAHPPCVYLTRANARNWREYSQQQIEAIRFVRWIAAQPVPYIAIENPVGILSVVWRKADQIIQPYQFGYCDSKATCLWLKGLPLLVGTKLVGPGNKVTHADKWNRWRVRAITFAGIAEAMADQWGSFVAAQLMCKANDL